MAGNRILTRGFYIAQVVGFDENPSNASLCRNCGRYAGVCPQRIAIPEEQKKVAQDLDGLSTKLMTPLVKMMFSRRQKE